MFDKNTMAAIRSVAQKHKIEEAALLAVVEVESAGTVFWKVGTANKPAIRFEGHYFYDRLKGEKLDRAIAAGLASKKVGGVANPRSYAARYQLLSNAVAIDAQAAYESTSWGLGQVMGAHWKFLGYGSVHELVADANTVEGQVGMMVRFIISNNLKRHLDNKDWAAFARAYNGPGYKKNAYDQKMADAYSRYSGNVPVITTDIGVIQMQRMLNAIGQYNLELDGVFGKNTKVALQDFQLKNGLKADGLYGTLSKEELEKDYVALTNKGQDILGKLGVMGGAAGTAVSEAAKQIEPLANSSQWLQYLFIGLTVVGVLLTLKATIWK